MAMELHPDEQVIFKGHPSWRSTLGFYLKGLLLALIPAAIALLAGVSTAGAIGIYVGLLVLVILVGLLVRLSTRYAITNQRLTIRRGILSRHVQETRVERVQNVNTNQSLLERLLGVGTVDFDTAGNDDSDFSFVGVARPQRVVSAVDEAHRAREQAARQASPDGGV